jgi:GTPase SAR1 family protein
MILYDITSRQSFQNVTQHWVPYFDSCGGSTAAKVLVGNKSDRDYSRVEYTHIDSRSPDSCRTGGAL